VKQLAEVIVELLDSDMDAVIRPGRKTKYGVSFGVVDSHGNAIAFEAVPARDEKGEYTAVLPMLGGKGNIK
jgi:uncharacterized protein GlcG (DUF336 family)